MACCVAWNCSNRAKKGTGITFHRFPKQPTRRKEWVRALRREGFQATEHSRICSNHFEESCFDRTGQTNRLKENAVPSLFDFPKHLQKARKEQKAPPNRETTDLSLTLPSTSKIVQDGHAATGVSYNHQYVGAEHSYCVMSPHNMKRRLDKNQDALDTYKKKLKFLYQKNRRLQKKITSLTEIVESQKSTSLISDS